MWSRMELWALVVCWFRVSYVCNGSLVMFDTVDDAFYSVKGCLFCKEVV